MCPLSHRAMTECVPVTVRMPSNGHGQKRLPTKPERLLFFLFYFALFIERTNGLYSINILSVLLLH